MHWMILPLRRYAQFTGRARRREFWLFLLFTILIGTVLGLVDAVLGLGGQASDYAIAGPGTEAIGAMSSGGLLAELWMVATVIPAIAVTVRRLHDVNRSGWWMLAPAAIGLLSSALTAAGAFLPASLLLFLGSIAGVALFVFMLLDGTRGPNRFGPDPKDLPAST